MMKFIYTFLLIILLLIQSMSCCCRHIKMMVKNNKNSNSNINSNSFLINQQKLSISKLGKELTESGYILTSLVQLMKISKGRSEVLDCIKLESKNTISDDIKVTLYKAKITKDADRYKREKSNYQKICGNSNNDNFVKVIEFSDEQIKGSSMVPKGGIIIQERGVIDLKILSEMNGPIRGKNLDQLIKRMVSTVAKIHSLGIIITIIIITIIIYYYYYY